MKNEENEEFNDVNIASLGCWLEGINLITLRGNRSSRRNTCVPIYLDRYTMKMSIKSPIHHPPDIGTCIIFSSAVLAIKTPSGAIFAPSTGRYAMTTEY